MVDAVAVFVMERLVVFVASGDVVAHPDFRSSALFFDEPGGFRHEQIEGEAGESCAGGGDLFLNAGNFQNGIGVGNVVVDGDIGKLVDLLFAGVAPDEVLGDLTGEVVGVDGNEFHAALFGFDSHINSRYIKTVKVDQNKHIIFI